MPGLSKKDVLRIAKQKDVRFIRLWFTDILGFLKSFSITIRERVREALGDHVFHQFIEKKKIEWERYRARVTDYELEQYLSIL
jgi:glutamine synthetase